jgi:hypothetical protein
MISNAERKVLGYILLNNNPLMEITTEDDREIRQLIHCMAELRT